MSKKRRIVQIVFDGQVVDAKECRTCNNILPLTQFSPKKGGLGGREYQCRVCGAERFKKYRERNREKENERARKNRQKNPDYLFDYYRDNKERIREVWSNWYKKNRNNIIKYIRNWEKENPSRKKEYRRKSERKNPVRLKIRRHRRRAFKKALPDTLTVSEFRDIHKFFGGKCPLTGSEDVVMEHFIALSTGHGGTTRENITLLARDLNTSKHSYNPFEWILIRSEKETEGFERVVEYLSKLNGLTNEEYKEFVFWCYENPRTVEQIKSDGNQTSLELWKKSKQKNDV